MERESSAKSARQAAYEASVSSKQHHGRVILFEWSHSSANGSIGLPMLNQQFVIGLDLLRRRSAPPPTTPRPHHHHTTECSTHLFAKEQRQKPMRKE
eukprot:scaffold389_cov211-Alexandrium_tamarense.AAC.11